ncbi:MAG: lipid-A-disaccharide synthase [Ignavibacteria bacterium]|nr:lipid-A-disaccharide synthase [Ignavibacteria bacterium]
MKEKPFSHRDVSVFISAGEHSGDNHASGLMQQLKAQMPGYDVKFYGLGGDMMTAVGMDPLYHVRDLATVGFTDVIKKYGFFKNAIKESAEFIKQKNPDVVILVDYPGFNIRLAESIRKFYTKKIIYYISPQLWAWHESRVNKIRKYIDLMLVVFPFEVDFYGKHGVKAEFVGHPLVKKIKEFRELNPKITGTGEVKRITLLPGSRKDEIKKHMPVLIEAMKILKESVNAEVVISIAPGMESHFDEFRESISGFTLSGESSYRLIYDSDLVLTKAGTSTMECTLLQVPYLIFYRTYSLNYFILKPIVRVDKLGIANILLEKNAVKEFIQNDFTAENLAAESLKILTDDAYRTRMLGDLRKIWDTLGSKDASSNAAALIIKRAGL